jgi:hypothetical protein
MVRRWFLVLSLGGLLAGCSSGSTASGADADGGGGPSVPNGRTVTFTANLKQEAGQLSFMTPTVSIIQVAASTVVGKPYMIAAYPAGFSPGNDPAITSTWGTVPDD